MGIYRNGKGLGITFVKSGIIKKKNGKFYLFEDLFSGVEIEFNEKGEGIRSTRFVNGIDCGEYISEFFPESEGYKVLDADFLEYYSPYVPSYHLEPPALVYFFEGAYAMCEELYDDNAFRKSEYCSHYTGNLEEVELGGAPVYEHYKWDEDGNPTYFYIIEKQKDVGDVFRIEIRLTSEKKELDFLALDGDCFKRSKDLQDQFQFDVPDNKEYFIDINGAERLLIYEEAVDDEVMINLMKKGGFDNVKELHLSRTAVSEDVLFKIAKSVNLEEFHIVGTLSSDLINRLKNENPDVEIKYKEQDFYE